MPNRRRLVASVAAFAVAGLTGIALVASSDASASTDARPAAVIPTAQDAAKRSIGKPIVGGWPVHQVPVRRGSAQAPRTRDDIVRELVRRGLVPAATLDDGTQITGPGVRAVRTRDDIVRDLVERGVIPAATLDDGTQIAAP